MFRTGKPQFDMRGCRMFSLRGNGMHWMLICWDSLVLRRFGEPNLHNPKEEPYQSPMSSVFLGKGKENGNYSIMIGYILGLY